MQYVKLGAGVRPVMKLTPEDLDELFDNGPPTVRCPERAEAWAEVMHAVEDVAAT